MECDSALKRKEEVLTQAITGMNFEDIMLSEIGHTQKYKCCRSLLT